MSGYLRQENSLIWLGDYDVTGHFAKKISNFLPVGIWPVGHNVTNTIEGSCDSSVRLG